MSRVDTTQIDALQWILQRLRTALGLNASTCFVAADDLAPAEIPPASVFITVTPQEGRFELEEQTIGNVLEDWTFRVRVYLRLSRDRPGADQVRLLDPQDGLLAWKRKILKALCGQDPGWNLGRTIAAVAATRTVWLKGGRSDLEYASLAVDFVMPIGWDLS